MNLSANLLPPLQAVSTATGGDGFAPILYRAGGKVEAWNLFHHSNTPAAVIVCTDLTTGQTCAGGPWPKPLNAAPGPLGVRRHLGPVDQLTGAVRLRSGSLRRRVLPGPRREHRRRGLP